MKCIPTHNIDLFSSFLKLGSSKTVITTKSDIEVKDLTSDPTWDKENDGDEDEAIDRASSDEDWKPPKKKRSRHGVPLLPAKVTSVNICNFILFPHIFVF